jgi:hypothetical protein
MLRWRDSPKKNYFQSLTTCGKLSLETPATGGNPDMPTLSKVLKTTSQSNPVKGYTNQGVRAQLTGIIGVFSMSAFPFLAGVLNRFQQGYFQYQTHIANGGNDHETHQHE